MSNDPWELPPPEEDGSDSWALPADDPAESRPSFDSAGTGDPAKPDAESAASESAASEPTSVEPSEQPAPAPQPQSESQPQASQDDAPEFAWSKRAPTPKPCSSLPSEPRRNGRGGASSILNRSLAKRKPRHSLKVAHSLPRAVKRSSTSMAKYWR